jgi:hypothetical protein
MEEDQSFNSMDEIHGRNCVSSIRGKERERKRGHTATTRVRRCNGTKEKVFGFQLAEI